MMCSRLVKHHAADRNLVHVADGFADHRKGVVADLAVGHQIIGPDQIAVVDIRLRYEFVDLDGSGRFQRDVVEFLFGHLDIGVGIDLVALHDVVGGDLFAGLGIDLGIFDAMAGLAVDLVEGDLLGIRGGRIQSDRAGHERKAQKALPIGAGGHGLLRRRNRRSSKDNTEAVGFKHGSTVNLRMTLTAIGPQVRLCW